MLGAESCGPACFYVSTAFGPLHRHVPSMTMVALPSQGQPKRRRARVMQAPHEKMQAPHEKMQAPHKKMQAPRETFIRGNREAVGLPRWDTGRHGGASHGRMWWGHGGARHGEPRTGGRLARGRANINKEKAWCATGAEKWGVKNGGTRYRLMTGGRAVHHDAAVS